jgi:hypothetical protein
MSKDKNKVNIKLIDHFSIWIIQWDERILNEYLGELK